MAYENDPVTGRTAAERQNRIHTEVRNERSAATPWIIAGAVIVLLVALLWFFGGTANQPPANAVGGGPVTGGEVAPQGTGGAAPGTGMGTEGTVAPPPDTAPAAPADPAPAAPVD